MTVPVGREQELDRAQNFLSAARDRFSVLLLEGDLGIGKTAVFTEIVRRASANGALVLQCRAAQAEAKLALSAVADLLESAPATIYESLSGPQRRALEVALLRADPGDEPIADRVLATATRSVLVGLSAVQPVVVAIDDIQWLDAASAAVLGYAFRRLADEPIGLLTVRRLGEPARLKIEEIVRPEALARETIGPMSMAAIHHLIKQHLGESLPRPTLVRVHEASGGNPLFALEIGRSLAEGGPHLPGQPLPMSLDVESLVRRRVRGLPRRTREVLLTAAALGDPREELVSEAVGRAIESDLEAAERRGIGSLVRGIVNFRHPLFSAALYASASPTDRRSLHGRLATVVGESEERARHLALAVSGRNEEAAVSVHAAAREASLRGSPAAAVELLELALAVGEPDAATEASRIFDLADNLALAGDNTRARELLDAVDPWQGWPPRVHGYALDLMLEVEYWIHGPGDELDRLGRRLLAGDLPPDVRAQVHVGLARYTEHDLSSALGHADAALALLDALGDGADPLVHAIALAFRTRNRLVLGGGLDRRAMGRVLELEAKMPAGQRRLDRGSDGFGQWVKYADHVDEARGLLESGLERDVKAGYEKGALNKLQHLALTECLAGNLELARDHALRACELFDLERNNVLGYAQAILAIVQAHLGDADGVYAMRDLYRAQGAPIHLQVALGLLELSLGHDGAAFGHLVGALDAADRAGLREPGIHRIHANAAEAAVAVGEFQRAEQITDDLEAHGRRTGHRWSLATGARCRGLLLAAGGDVDGGLAACEQAVAHHQDLPMPFERARTLLVAGVIERRARLRSQSKQSLLEAAESFERMGARIWAARARRELDRIGLRRSAGDELTETERRVAELTATGMTNREVAAALFVSPKTVEANLGRVYRKLGIGSRAELGSHMKEPPQT